jgi:hypothetical protein
LHTGGQLLLQRSMFLMAVSNLSAAKTRTKSTLGADEEKVELEGHDVLFC